MIPEIPELTPPLPKANPFDMALIIDNEVFTVMNVDGQLAAALSANPVFVQVTDGETQVGWTYNPATGEFTAPAPEPEPEQP
jgi:hypothetical protein